ncbi:MAG: sugar transporter [Flavobacterium psychrophilum]|nr:MAG: sugar transporter [Flavobacterium psychrophilum]
MVVQILTSVLLIGISSCAGVKKAKKDLIYLREGSLDSLPNLTVPTIPIEIQTGDLLSITVYSDNPEATQMYNQGGSVSSITTSATPDMSSASSKSASGYLVDKEGYIRMPGFGLGKIKAGGMSKDALADTLVSRLNPYLKNHFVDIRVLNSRVTVLGEIQKPGSYNIPSEKLSILELFGLAGDVTLYGRKDNVLVIREVNGKRQFGRIDLRRADAFQSPYFYLLQNDVVVIEPNAKKQTATEQDNLRKITLVTALATFVSTISILVTLFR